MGARASGAEGLHSGVPGCSHDGDHRKIAETLLNAGENVRALGRSESKLAELERGGAEVCIGDTNDAAFLARAFRGADAVYTLLPTDRRAPDYRAAQDLQGEAIANASARAACDTSSR